MAEVVVLKKTELDLVFEREVKRAQIDEENSSSNKNAAKRRKTGKESEIQGALALMELARN